MERHGAVTNFIREELRRTTGATASLLFQACRQAGLATTTGSVRSAIFRLRAAGEIRSTSGRHYILNPDDATNYQDRIESLAAQVAAWRNIALERRVECAACHESIERIARATGEEIQKEIDRALLGIRDRAAQLAGGPVSQALHALQAAATAERAVLDRRTKESKRLRMASGKGRSGV